MGRLFFIHRGSAVTSEFRAVVREPIRREEVIVSFEDSEYQL